ERRRRALGASSAAEGRRERQFRLLYQLLQPQGTRARGPARRLRGVPLVGAGAPGAGRGRGRESRRRGIGCLLREPPARRAPLRLGLGAERTGGRSRGFGEIVHGKAAPVRRPSAAPAALGRLPARPAGDRALAGPRGPAARPAALSPARQELVPSAPPSLSLFCGFSGKAG